jgi:hypothetical protein
LFKDIYNLDVCITRKVSAAIPVWEQTDCLVIKEGSIMKYAGTVAKLKLQGPLNPHDHILELIQPICDSKQITPGDFITLSPKYASHLLPLDNNYV